MKIKKTSSSDLKELMSLEKGASAIVVDHLGLIFCVVSSKGLNWMAINSAGTPEMFKSKPAAVSWLTSIGVLEKDISVEVWRQNRGYIEWVEVVIGNPK